jgi:tetratricopeptide (TPR) repeat protein
MGDALAALREGVLDLYCEEAFYFGADKEARLAASAAPLIAAARALQPSTAGGRAEVALLLGRALDVASAYSPAAEEALSRAVRLDPTSAEAWSALGHCAWKKGDLAAAAAHYGASVKRRPTPEALRSLSQLARASLARGAPLEVARAAHADSVAHAKAAVELALEDGPSWAVLGLAHLSTANAVSRDEEDYRRAARAFTRAASLEAEGARDPTLHVNRAAALSFLEDYAGALAAYALAGQLDPSLNSAVRGVAGGMRASEQSKLTHHSPPPRRSSSPTSAAT